MLWSQPKVVRGLKSFLEAGRLAINMLAIGRTVLTITWKLSVSLRKPTMTENNREPVNCRAKKHNKQGSSSPQRKRRTESLAVLPFPVFHPSHADAKIGPAL